MKTATLKTAALAVTATFVLSACGGPATSVETPPAGTADPSATPEGSAAPTSTPGALDASEASAPLPLSDDAVDAILAKPDWLAHLGGGIIDNECPQVAFDKKVGGTPSEVSLTDLSGEKSIMIGGVEAKSFQILHKYLSAPPHVEGRTFIYRLIPEGLLAGYQAFCVYDDTKMTQANFTQAKAQNAVRFTPETLEKLRASDPKNELFALTIDGTFVMALPLEGLRKLKDPVITVSTK